MEYRVRWKDKWLSRSELGNAKTLLQEFDAQGRAHCGGKGGNAARKDKGRRSLATLLYCRLTSIECIIFNGKQPNVEIFGDMNRG
jgi:hypothetical protein